MLEVNQILISTEWMQIVTKSKMVTWLLKATNKYRERHMRLKIIINSEILVLYCHSHNQRYQQREWHNFKQSRNNELISVNSGEC